jgi:hypothetical protein
LDYVHFFLPGTRTVVLALDSGSAVEFLVAGMNFAVVSKHLEVCEHTYRYFTLCYCIYRRVGIFSFLFLSIPCRGRRRRRSSTKNQR